MIRLQPDLSELVNTLRQVSEGKQRQVAEAKREAAEDATVEDEEYTKLFIQARAANCLLFAMEEDPFIASTEAVYEALATTDEGTELLNIIRSILA